MPRDSPRVFDGHAHVTGIFLRQGTRKLTLLEYMDAMGIDKAVVSPVQPNANMNLLRKLVGGGGDLRGAFPFEEYVYEPHFAHEDVKALVDAAPGRVVGSFWFNPSYARTCEGGDVDPFEPLERALSDWGFRAVKLQTTIHRLQPRDLEGLGEFLEDQGVPLFVHPSPGFFAYGGFSPKDLLGFATAHPELPIVVGHFAYAMEACIESVVVAARCPNVYLDTSLGIPYGILLAHKVLGPDRLLFGSDGPAATPASLEVEKFRVLAIPGGDKRKIFYDNAARLYLGEDA
ncbi:MAG: amidohydrolase family protein [Promethearchaeota archaeon]